MPSAYPNNTTIVGLGGQRLDVNVEYCVQAPLDLTFPVIETRIHQQEVSWLASLQWKREMFRLECPWVHCRQIQSAVYIRGLWALSSESSAGERPLLVKGIS